MKFGYTIVYVPSVPDALSFYERAFGFKVRFLHETEQYGELESGITTLAFASHRIGDMNFGAGYAPLSATALPPGIELAFVTEDVSAAYSKAVSAGAVPIKAPEEKPWGQVVAYVRAQEGTLVELCSPIAG